MRRFEVKRLLKHKMTDGRPVYRGRIGTETAKSAEVLLQKGNRVETERFPFDNIAVETGLEAVKDEVEQVG